jgi:hypothetical protein
MMSVTIRRQTFKSETLEVLRDMVRRFIDDNGYGASDVGGRWRVHGATALRAEDSVTHLSYNGRFWNRLNHEVSI